METLFCKKGFPNLPKKLISQAVIITAILALPLTALSQSSRLFVKQAHKDTAITGFTRSCKDVMVSSEVTGKVTKINYDEGDTITKAPFIEIDTTFTDLKIENTKKTIEKIDTQIRSINSKIAFLEKEYKRTEALFKKDTVSEVKMDAAKQDLEQAQLSLGAALAEKASLEISLKEQAEIKNRHTIKAPEGFIVTMKALEAGDNVEIGKVLASVSDYRNLVVPLSVSNDELEAIKSLPKEFEALLEGKPVKASLNWINPKFNEETRKLNIEIAVSSYEGQHRGGLRFTVPIKLPADGLMIPKAAVISRYENPKVILKDSGASINLIALDETDDFLIVANDERLKDGTELKPPSPSK
ncbi:Secretion protein HlyD [Candidatus Magnetoovum chiemensis]|nr:Secretion protein HlyD [Candidatus Magnetoovum chiemensis]